MTDAFPLQWPLGWPRSKHPQSARFNTSFAQARDGVLEELLRMGASHIVISTNVETRRDGVPYANRPQPPDRGVAVYFTRDGKQQCIPCDKWNKIEDNLPHHVRHPPTGFSWGYAQRYAATPKGDQ